MSIRVNTNKTQQIVIRNTPPTNPSNGTLWLNPDIGVIDTIDNNIDLNRFTTSYTLRNNESGIYIFTDANLVNIPLNLSSGIYMIRLSMTLYDGTVGEHILSPTIPIAANSIIRSSSSFNSNQTSSTLKVSTESVISFSKNMIHLLVGTISAITTSKSIQYQSMSKDSAGIITTDSIFMKWDDPSALWDKISLYLSFIKSLYISFALFISGFFIQSRRGFLSFLS